MKQLSRRHSSIIQSDDDTLRFSFLSDNSRFSTTTLNINPDRSSAATIEFTFDQDIQSSRVYRRNLEGAKPNRLAPSQGKRTSLVSVKEEVATVKASADEATKRILKGQSPTTLSRTQRSSIFDEEPGNLEYPSANKSNNQSIQAEKLQLAPSEPLFPTSSTTASDPPISSIIDMQEYASDQSQTSSAQVLESIYTNSEDLRSKAFTLALIEPKNPQAMLDNEIATGIGGKSTPKLTLDSFTGPVQVEPKSRGEDILPAPILRKGIHSSWISKHHRIVVLGCSTSDKSDLCSTVRSFLCHAVVVLTKIAN
jgi:hypothetical protein